MATKETEEKKEKKRRRPVCVLCVPVCNNMAAMRFFGSIHGTPETFAAAIGEPEKKLKLSISVG